MTDRDYERMERRRKLHEKSMVTSIVAGVVIAVALIAIAIVVAALISKNSSAPQPEPTQTVTEQPTLYRPEEPTQAPTQAVQPTQTAWNEQPTQAAYTPATQPQDNATLPAGPTQEPTVTAATASTEAGAAEADASSAAALAGALHYYAAGETSYGYDWTYSGGAGVVSVTCNYDFASHQYDFVIMGVAPGTTAVSLIYNTGDDQQVTVPMTVSVDADLKVTQIG